MAKKISTLTGKLTLSEIREIGPAMRTLDRQLRKYERRLRRALDHLEAGTDTTEIGKAIQAIEALSDLRYLLSEAWEQAAECPESHDPMYGNVFCSKCR